MKRFVCPTFVAVLVACFLCVTYPRVANSTVTLNTAATTKQRTVANAEPAIAYTKVAAAGESLLRDGWMSSQPDTTQPFEFPGEENKHLYRDITIWIIVSAFVAFFIIKVFLEGDTDLPDEEGGGKTIPGQ